MYLADTYGPNCCSHIDAVDMTFACIGAVDALQNTADWVTAGKNRKGIVIASDFAKYKLKSSGEYTQGAGAVALLVSNNPALIEFDDEWAVSTQSVHDFFKPRRKHEFNALENGSTLAKSLDNSNTYFEEFKETPVFDGQYSNECYQNRMIEAYNRYKKATTIDLNQWQHLVFHLPYAFHGRRIIAPIFIDEVVKNGLIEQIAYQLGIKKEDKGFARAVSKSDEYKAFVKQKIAKSDQASSEVGNMYTASIFMAFLSLLSNLNEDNSGEKIGFIAYGSGSKAKVFSGNLNAGFTAKTQKWELFETLSQRDSITFNQYELLHSGSLTKPLKTTNSYFALKEIKQYPLAGERVYQLLKA
ncbi:MAG: hydroxymethylglutaryl-CoA synthase family protein [Bacteroidia bacterium]